MADDERVLRFRRGGFQPPHDDVEPAWHRAARQYDEREIYGSLTALCDYSPKGMTAMTVEWSRRKVGTAPKGRLCKRCETRAKQAAK